MYLLSLFIYYVFILEQNSTYNSILAKNFKTKKIIPFFLLFLLFLLLYVFFLFLLKMKFKMRQILITFIHLRWIKCSYNNNNKKKKIRNSITEISIKECISFYYFFSVYCIFYFIINTEEIYSCRGFFFFFIFCASDGDKRTLILM